MRITVANKSYAAGLFWQSCEEKQRKKVSQDLGIKLQYHYACWRKSLGMGSHPQIGLIRKEQGLTWGLPSIAAALADQIPGSWIGAWKIPEGYLVLSVREDLIEPEGDLVFEKEEDARAKIEKEIKKGAYLKLYLPQSWGVEKSEDIALKNLLGPAKSRLSYIFFPTRIALMATALVSALLLLVYGVSSFLEKRAETLRLENIAAGKASLNGTTQEGVLEYPRVWETHPHPRTWLKACQNKLKTIPSNLLGWKSIAFGCGQGQAVVEWAREPGYAETPEDLSLSSDGTTAQFSASFEVLAPRGQEELSRLDANTRFLFSKGLPVTISTAPDDPAPSPEYETRGIRPQWKKRSLIFHFKTLPWAYEDVLDAIKGLVLHRLEWSIDGGEWILEGVLYEKR